MICNQCVHVGVRLEAYESFTSKNMLHAMVDVPVF
jgi:hypothetical protein